MLVPEPVMLLAAAGRGVTRDNPPLRYVFCSRGCYQRSVEVASQWLHCQQCGKDFDRPTTMSREPTVPRRAGRAGSG